MHILIHSSLQWISPKSGLFGNLREKSFVYDLGSDALCRASAPQR